jgi:hypothetical protein
LLTFDLNSNKLSWVVDFNATCHMMNNTDWFTKYNPYPIEAYVYLGDDTHYKMHASGKITIKLTNGKTKHILEILHAPSLTKILIFVL